MQQQRTELSLFDLLSNNIRELQKIEDDPKTLTFVARRLGNIVKHMKDLREDLQPRGGSNARPSAAPQMESQVPSRIEVGR